MSDLETLPVGEDAPRVVNAVVEVPVGSRNKYEYDEELSAITLDRVLPGSLRYPADYGFIPSTETERGDALDVFVADYDAVFPGCIVRVRPVGALETSDSKGHEFNIFAVPTSDPRFSDIDSLDDLPGQSLLEVEQFYTTYKKLEGDDGVELLGWRSAEEVREIIARCALGPPLGAESSAEARPSS